MGGFVALARIRFVPRASSGWSAPGNTVLPPFQGLYGEFGEADGVSLVFILVLYVGSLAILRGVF